ncbi:MAG: selenocysteine-specific translation elongation factor [Planctomycetales bacterium]|nr:selenocysteine-specific translation elongation factor [Planctomycetales bacterium]NIM10136.1 selenocysteine-specific translation elongation factor [Planctomycetales bacterium]NIN08378.1 selenocysteine-specific translation elongation factor [Planctomycetales bacterium]NIN77506.1 selenocysteine-specific translation elongation factor [Planctomycetales bacterium]NIO34678.1 selenocysteine-specific translation elongation factor [Planctomycetales bacterium]
MATDFILGTAGHIDHGKTALVRALTGRDTDRLPEEKRRGITIELGFAELVLGDLRLGIVDVPGHERFVRNMLAGATGMDLALLVVAADDSVKPQTREHLDILRLLNLQAGVIALTKCDVADAEWIELVEGEVRELVAGTFLADAAIVRTSAQSGEGIDCLRAELAAAAAKVACQKTEQPAAGPFRMAIDRVFSVAGHGTVVTGSVLRGQAAVGDELVIEPGSHPVRVRGLHSHDRVVDRVHRGQRAAVNLAGLHHEQIRRGHELASPGLLRATRLMTAQIQLLPSAQQPLKNRRRVRLHLGTTEVMASVLLHQQHELAAGQQALAQLLLAKPAVTTWGQPFVIRRESPVVTIGGGRVLAPDAQKLKHDAQQDWHYVHQLCAEDELTRAAAAVYFAGWDDWQSDDLARTAGVNDPAAIHKQLLASHGLLETVPLSPTRTAQLHHARAETLRERIVAALETMHEENPRQLVFPQAQLAHRFAYLHNPPLYRAMLASLIDQQRVLQSPAGLSLPGKGPRLSKNEQQLLDKMIIQYQQAGGQPPLVTELQQQAARNQAAVPQLVELAAAQGHLVQLTAELYMHQQAVEEIREKLTQRLAERGGLTVSQIREALQTTRKFAVPLCEYFDRIGFTRRDGDLRVLARQGEGRG